MQRARTLALLGSQWALFIGLSSAQSDTLAPAEAGWWKSLFRPKTIEAALPDSTPAFGQSDQPSDSSSKSNFESDGAMSPSPEVISTAQEPLPVQPVASWRIQADDRLQVLDSAWRAQPPKMEGYRIQLMTGSLQDCRLQRSSLRNESDLSVYLVPHSRDYQVLLGDFRDPWSAERERDRWVERYPNSLVIPGEIALPPMASSQNTIAEPLKELGDE